MKERPSDRGLILFGVALASFAAYQQFKLPPALPLLLEAYHYPKVLAGSFMAVYALMGLLLSLPLGRVIERDGPKRPILAALLLFALGSLLALLWPQSGALVLAGRALEGAGFAVCAICGPVLAQGGASRRHLPLVFGLVALWIPLGQIGATLAAPLAFAAWGWQPLWWLAILGCLGFAIWTGRIANGGRSAFEAADRHESRALPPTRRELVSLVIAGGIFMVWSGQYFAFATWLPQYLVEDLGLDIQAALLGYLLPVVILSLFNVLTGLLLRHGVPLLPLLAITLVSQALVWLLLPWIAADWTGILLLAFYGVGAGIAPTCLFGLPAAIAGQARARAFGVMMTGRNLGVLIGPVLLPAMLAASGEWAAAAPIFGVATLVVFGFAIWLARRLEQDRIGLNQSDP